MGAREGRLIGGSLLALCLLVGDAPRAMEPGQAGADVPFAQALPDFLDDARLPALQEAWRAHEAAPEGTAQPAPAPPEQSEQGGQAATPAAPASGDGSVRERAEELSRRFGAEGTPSEPEKAPTSVMIPPAVVPAVVPTVIPETPPEVRKQIVVKPDIPVRKSAIKRFKAASTRVESTAALPDSSSSPDPSSLPESTKSSLIGEKLRLAAPPPPSEDMPPLPKQKRAPKARSTGTSSHGAEKSPEKSSSPSPAKTVIVRVKKPAPAPALVQSGEAPPDPKAALRGTVLTDKLGAFGWNSQPK